MPVDPGAAFAEFEQRLVSSSGEDAFLVALRLLASKLVDELQVRQGAAPCFTLSDDPGQIKARIETLYRQAIIRFPKVNGLSGKLGLSTEQLVRCLGPLLGWSMLDSDLAHLDATLERLVAPEAKGALGQYFTPRAVVRLCVRALDPRPSDTVIDPACGSGGFLFEAVRHARAVHGGAPRCLGIDLGARSIAIAQLLSYAVTDGAIRICRGDSLDARGFDADAAGSSFEALRCSLLFANPPFAGEIDDPVLLATFQAQRALGVTKRASTIARDHLFVERAVQLLEPGGRLAIVVPQGLLANSSASYLRRWLSERCRVLAVVGLHPQAFHPHTGVKTSILFLERPRQAAKSDDRPLNQARDASVFFAVSRGDDHDAIGCALAEFIATRRAPGAVPQAEIAQHDRLDAEYWDATNRGLQTRLAARTTGRLGEAMVRSIERFRRRGATLVDYIDISCVDARTGVATPTTLIAEEAPSRASWLVLPGDVLVSTVRPERNVVALIDRPSTRPRVASNGFCVLRPNGVAPELVYAFCKTATFRALLMRRATATMYPAVTDRDVLDLPFLQPNRAIAEAIVEKVRAAFDAIDSGKRALEGGIALMEKSLDE